VELDCEHQRLHFGPAPHRLASNPDVRGGLVVCTVSLRLPTDRKKKVSCDSTCLKSLSSGSGQDPIPYAVRKSSPNQRPSAASLIVRVFSAQGH
jgi:hypothetical protein